MEITSEIFAAYLDCRTRCSLVAKGEPGSANAYATWSQEQDALYGREAIERLASALPEGQAIIAPSVDLLKDGTWRLAADVAASSDGLSNTVGVVQRAWPQGRIKSEELIPIRFTYRNKLSRNEKLILAFDALTLSQSLRHEISYGKIIHGEDHAPVIVKVRHLVKEVRNLVAAISEFLSKNTSEVILNRHCHECQFQSQCRQHALGKDDLSLLPHLTEKERKKLHSKGLFTVTQLSYMFRPRRRKNHPTEKPEKYHHTLKALAIRTQKIHIVGRTPFKVAGTPVYFDVESVPDRDFYYLIGVRYEKEQHFFWADAPSQEITIWNSFLTLLSGIDNPVLVHFGSFETTFLARMCERYGTPQESSPAHRAITSPVNVLSHIYARIYFPTFSNGLKEVGRYLGVNWPAPLTGIEAIILRSEWELAHNPLIKESLCLYNAKDCEALEVISNKITELGEPAPGSNPDSPDEVINAGDMKRKHAYGFGRNEFAIAEFKTINESAYWDYQREKIYLKSNKRIKKAVSSLRSQQPQPRINKLVTCPRPASCPNCLSKGIYKHQTLQKTVIDLKFMRFGLKRWIVRYHFARYHCPVCGAIFTSDKEWTRSKFGLAIRAFSIYQAIELRVPQDSIARSLNKLLGYNFSNTTINHFKAKAAEVYTPTYKSIVTSLAKGALLHADETNISVEGQGGYVWVLASMEAVAYIYKPTRDAAFLHVLLEKFTGVLLSDFYPAYEGIPCTQQKCLIHLIRDLNDALFQNPFDQELKWLVKSFADVLKPIVDTIDRHGLKRRFLGRHQLSVDRFFTRLVNFSPLSEFALKCKARFLKNRDTLFTFLKHDGIPWNNNNAEHAIKPFAILRRTMSGVTTPKGLQEYLVLLTICETCHYKGVDFLSFLRSGEVDIDHFAEGNGKIKKHAGPNPTVAACPAPRTKRKPKKRRRMKDQILTALKTTGNNEFSVQDVAKLMGLHYHTVKSWFYTTGKGIAGLTKTGRGRFKYNDEADRQSKCGG